jgi:TetR/AcrR family transcriptional regulator, lmrAB and yxaGH operons repressor
MPAALITKEEVVSRLFVAFRDHGYEGASLAELSRATGLGKSSLYHYFPGGKEDMARAVLDFVETWFAENVFAPLSGKGTPRERLQRMLDSMNALYDGGKNPCLLGNLATAGASRSLFQKRLRAAFAAWVDAIEAIAIEGGVPKRSARARAEDVIIGLEGALVLAAGLDDPAPFRRALRRAPSALFDGEARV